MTGASIKLIRHLFTDYFCLGKKFLVYNMVNRNIKSKYDRSFFGLGWTLLSPLSLAAIYYVVFKKIMNVHMDHYLPFILSGVLPWAFFSQCVLEGMNSIVDSQGLVTKIPLPLQVLPFVNIITNFITFSASIPVIVLVSFFQGAPLGWHTLLILYFYAQLFLLAYAFALVLSVGLVFFRDLRHAMTLLLQVWFFATPNVYSFTMVPPQYRVFVHLNPVADVISGLHTIFTDGVMPGAHCLMISTGWTLVCTAAGMFFMRKRLKRILEKL